MAKTVDMPQVTDKLDRNWLPQIQLSLLHTLTYTSKVTVKTG